MRLYAKFAEVVCAAGLWLALLQPLAAVAAGAMILPPDPASTVARDLGAARLAVQQRQFADANLIVHRILDDNRFAGLASPDQHDVLVLAARIALALQQPKEAHQLAARACEFTGADADDWLLRADASLRQGDSEDAAFSLTTVARRWTAQLKGPAQALLMHTVFETRKNGLDRAHDGLLEALYEKRFRVADGSEPSVLWQDLALSLMSRNDGDHAKDVIAHITDPYVMISMRADRRFKVSPWATDYRLDVTGTAAAEVRAAQESVQSHPERLDVINRLARALRTVQHYQDLLAVAEPAIARVRSAEGDFLPYCDVHEQYAWLLNLYSEALAQLGRDSEAIAAMREAVAYSVASDPISHSINLAILLCALGHPQEALQALPSISADMSPYGHMELAFVQADAAAQLGDSSSLAGAIGYLQGHQDDAPSVLMSALLNASRTDEAARIAIQRLNNSLWRGAALLEAQEFGPTNGPRRSVEARKALQALYARADVRAALDAVGSVGRYKSLSPP